MSARRCVSPCKIKAGNASQATFLDDIILIFFEKAKQIQRLKLGRATWVGLEEGGHRRSVGRVGDDAVAEQEPERTARHFVEQMVGAFGWGRL